MKTSLPKVIKSKKGNEDLNGFPVKHYSQSAFTTFSTNPVKFQLNYIQGIWKQFNVNTSASALVGSAVHKGLETYYGGNEEYPVTNEAEGVQYGIKTIIEYVVQYNEGFIDFNATVKTKKDILEKAIFGFQKYLEEMGVYGEEEIISIEEKLEGKVSVQYKGKEINLPVKLKGYLDKLVRKENGKLRIIDYKTSLKGFPNPDRLDGAKMIQAIQYYFQVFAEYGEEPEDFVYQVIKLSKNRDKTAPQVKEYVINYKEHQIMFDFYLRLYGDITNALLGKQVYVPNIYSTFDNEISLLAYIHRLDEPEELAKQLEKNKVKNVSDLLTKKIAKASTIKKFEEIINTKLRKVKNMDYSTMKDDGERIVMKLGEFAIPVSIGGLHEGHSVDLWEIEPAMGTKIKDIKAREEDLANMLQVDSVRVITYKGQMAIEIPRKKRTFPEDKAVNDKFNFAMGVDIKKEVVMKDVRDFPHLLVAGTTGSGKSVFLDTIVKQIINTNSNLLLADPKGTEFLWAKNNAQFHSSDIMEIHYMLEGAVKEVDEKFKNLAKKGLKNITDRMKREFIVIDEYGDLVAQDYIESKEVIVGHYQNGNPKTKLVKKNISKEIAKNVQLLAQKSRAVGVHLIIATQRPSVDVITGAIKGNFATKAVFRTAKAIDSQVVIDEAGAEKLLGKGDMLFQDHTGTVRLQGLM